MKRKSRAIIIAVTFGAMWGLAEATIGTGLHLTTRITGIPGLSGMVMFPVALLFMHRAFVRAGSAGIIPAMSAVAALIKLTGLVLPQVSAMDTIHPALAILLEGVAGYLLLGTAASPRRAFSIPGVFIAAAGWKAVFLGAELVMGTSSGMALLSHAMILRFVLVDSAANALLAVGAFRLLASAPARPTPARLQPVTAVGLFILAVMTHLGALLLV